MELNILVDRGGAGVVTLSAVGRINQENHEQFDKAIREVLSGSVKTLVFDMRGVEYISSAGVGVVVKAKASMAEKKGEVAMVNLQPQVERVFEIIQLLPMLNVFANVEELDDYLTTIQDRIIEEGTSLSSE